MKLSEQEITRILDTMQDTYYRTDNEGRLVVVSRSIETLLGYSVEEALGCKLSEYYVDEDGREKFIALLKEQQGHVSDYRAPLRHRSGKSVWVSTNAHYYRDEQGNILGVEGTTRNISDQITSEQQTNLLQRQLRQAQKMESIGQLTGGLAHNFNNILTSIIGFASLGLENIETLEREKIELYFKEIYQSGERAQEFVRQMLTFSRGHGLKDEQTNPVDLVNDSRKMLQVALPSSIRISVKIEDELPPVMCDPSQMQQVLMNLCMNAKDAMKGSGLITITLSRRKIEQSECSSCHNVFAGDFVSISVEDAGAGVEPGLENVIFDPFFSTKDVGQGTGMGLSMVHGIVHDHGGHIEVKGGMGQGAIFEVLIPVSSGESHKEEKQDRSVVAPELNNQAGKRVLLVDDEPAVATLLTEILKRYDYDVTTTTDSREALKAFEEKPDAFDLILSDQTMPFLTGIDLAGRVRQIRKDIPVIICSGFSEDINKDNYTKYGVNFYLAKPIDMKDLLSSVQKALKQDGSSTPD